MKNEPLKISIAGLGWFGSALGRGLKTQHQIRGTTRSEMKAQDFQSEGISCEVLTPDLRPSETLMDADVFVLNIPPFPGQLDWFKSWNWRPRTHVIFISSTSVYGQEEGILDESVVPLPVTDNGQHLVQEEAWVRSLTHHTIIRCGGLIGGERHPGKILSGRKNLDGGNQPVNLIHLDDVLGFVELVISQKLQQQTFNLVAPSHPSRRAYYQGFCRKHQLPEPGFKDSPISGKTISSAKVEKIYSFKVGTLEVP